MRKPAFCICENKDADQLCGICAFVFATRIVQSLFFLNPKFQVSSHLLRLYSPVCVGRTWSETPKTGFLTTRLKYSVSAVTDIKEQCFMLVFKAIKTATYFLIKIIKIRYNSFWLPTSLKFQWLQKLYKRFSFK